MAVVTVYLSEELLDGDYSSVDGIVAVCSRCGHETQSFGTTESSALRCAALMREECPNGESNFYQTTWGTPSEGV